MIRYSYILTTITLLFTFSSLGQDAEPKEKSEPKVVYLKDAPPVKVTKAKPGVKTEFVPNKVYGHALMQSFTSDDGLAMDAISSGDVSAICDSKGHMWFCTQGGGVSRYDGDKFVNFTSQNGIAYNSVMCMLEDNSGNFWFGSAGGGVTKYDGHTFTSFSTNDSLADNYLNSIRLDAEGNVWMGTSGGLSMFDGKEFTNYRESEGLPSDRINTMLFTKEGNFLVGTSKGLALFKAGKFVQHPAFSEYEEKTVYSLMEDILGNIWVGTSEGLLKYDGRNITKYSVEDGLAHKNVLVMLEDRNNELWFGTEFGLTHYDGKKFMTFTTENGIVNDIIRSLTEDNSGNLWIGTYGGGISKYDGATFVTYDDAHGLAGNSFLCLTKDNQGRLWFGGDTDGISMYDGTGFTTYTEESGLTDNYILSSFQDSKGNYWFGTDGGLDMFDGEFYYTYTEDQGLANNTVLCMFEEADGTLWMGTEGGVSVFDGEKITTYKQDQGLVNEYILNVNQDHLGRIWFGTDWGISVWDGKEFHNITTENGLSNDAVVSIIKDRLDNIWIGTYGGGVCIIKKSDIENVLDYADNSKVPVYNISLKSGLPDNGVAAVRQDLAGNLVIGTNYGLAILSEKNAQKILEGKPGEVPHLNTLDIYNQFNGYPIKDVNTGSSNGTMTIDHDGKAWVAHGSNGITFVDLDAVYKSEKVPEVVISALNLNNEKMCWYELLVSSDQLSSEDSVLLTQQEIGAFGWVLTKKERQEYRKKYEGIVFSEVSRFYGLPENMEIPYDHNHISFEFNGIETGKNYLVKYQYKLEGNDNEWSPLSGLKTATYSNLREGTYTFTVKCLSPNGVWSGPAKYSFTILPPWYRTWWAYLMFIAFDIFVVWGIIRFQTRRLKKRQKELAAEVKRQTQEIEEKSKDLEVERDEAKRQKVIAEEQMERAIKLKGEIEVAHEQLADHHRHITDSINYAKRIQDAVLATEEYQSHHLPEHFIYFQPKDVVSGDFYWALEKQGHLYFAVADCTGHGVPGAFMSMLGIAFLNEINGGDQLKTPAEILNELRDKIIKELGSTHDDASEIKDGMDISLIRYNLETKELLWSGANNPLYVIKNKDGKETEDDVMDDSKYIKIYKSHKQSISYGYVMTPYPDNVIDINDGDEIILFTDGYADQFGGEKGKKFKYLPFKNLLLELKDVEDIKEQKVMIHERFDEWKAEEEQVDDVCVVGIRFNETYRK